MKKILLATILSLLIIMSILIIRGVKEKNKMDTFFSPVINKDEYIISTESNRFSFEYSVKINNMNEDELFDEIIYDVVVINNTENILKDFMVVFRFEENMKKYLPSPFFYIEPITLYNKQPDSELKNYMTSYTRKSLVRKISKLSRQEYEEFIEIYKNLYLEITWDGGEEKILINDPTIVKP